MFIPNIEQAMRLRRLAASSMVLMTSGLIFGAIAQQPDSDTSGPSKNGSVDNTNSPAAWRLGDGRIAIEEARRCVGYVGTEESGIEASLAIVEHDNSPFVNSQIAGRQLWLVTLRQWSQELKSTPIGMGDRYLRTIDVTLDPVSGQVLLVRSRIPEGVEELPPEPEAAVAEVQMRKSGGEVYHGLPVDASRVTFVQALDSIQGGGGNPLIAKQIVARYVQWSKAGRWQEPRAVWAITLRGVPARRDTTAEGRSPKHDFRYIVDAMTGEYLCGSNTPRPVSAP